MIDDGALDELADRIAHRLAMQTTPLLDADGAAALLGVPSSWVLTEARAGRLPHVKVGKYTRFRRYDLLEWIDRRAK